MLCEEATVAPTAHPIAAKITPELNESFRRDALRAWQDYLANGLHVSAPEAEQWLAALEAGLDVEPTECHR